MGEQTCPHCTIRKGGTGMEKIRYFTKSLLIEYNNAAIRENRNRQLKEDYLEKLPDGINFPIIYHFFHTKHEIRVDILFDLNGGKGFLDMSVDRFQILPVAHEGADGKYIFESESEVRKKFPYKNREWTEKVIKQPYRKQAKFRQLVLEAYDNKCAICGMNEPKILRAAHIVPVAKGGTDEIQNGICLCTNHEISFDQGLIKISPTGDIEVNCKSIEVICKKTTYPKDTKNYSSKEYLKMKYDESYNE